MFRDEDADRYVAHFTSLETFEKYIVPQLRLRMSRFANVNDPRESRIWDFGLSLHEDLVPRAGEWNAVLDRLSAHLKDNAKLLCVTQDKPNLDPNRLAYLYGRCYAHPSMWDRYAAGHTGVCLMLDKEKLHAAVERAATGRGGVFGGPVSYADEPPHVMAAFHLSASETGAIVEGREQAVFEEHQRANLDAFYFWKSMDWSPEFEYRWVLLDSSADDVFVDISEALTGVIFGDRAPELDSQRVAGALAGQKIDFSQLRYRNGHPIALPYGQ